MSARLSMVHGAVWRQTKLVKQVNYFLLLFYFCETRVSKVTVFLFLAVVTEMESGVRVKSGQPAATFDCGSRILQVRSAVLAQSRGSVPALFRVPCFSRCLARSRRDVRNHQTFPDTTGAELSGCCCKETWGKWRTVRGGYHF